MRRRPGDRALPAIGADGEVFGLALGAEPVVDFHQVAIEKALIAIPAMGPGGRQLDADRTIRVLGAALVVPRADEEMDALRARTASLQRREVREQAARVVVVPARPEQDRDLDTFEPVPDAALRPPIRILGVIDQGAEVAAL